MIQNDLKVNCPYCKEEDSLVVLERGFIDYDKKKHLNLLVLKCRKCHAFISNIHGVELKEITPEIHPVINI